MKDNLSLPKWWRQTVKAHVSIGFHGCMKQWSEARQEDMIFLLVSYTDYCWSPLKQIKRKHCYKIFNSNYDEFPLHRKNPSRFLFSGNLWKQLGSLPREFADKVEYSVFSLNIEVAMSKGLGNNYQIGCWYRAKSSSNIKTFIFLLFDRIDAKKIVTTPGQLPSGQLKQPVHGEDDGRNVHVIRKFTCLTTKHIIFRSLCTNNFPVGVLLILSYDAMK